MSQTPDHSMIMTVVPIMGPDIERVAAFLHQELNPRVSPAQWADGMRTRWVDDQPNHGFMLLDHATGTIAGVNLAFYSTRSVLGRQERFCNLGALCIRPEHRGEALRLLRALLRQRGYHFTDLSPSGNVVAINQRLGFREIDTTGRVVVNLPWPPLAGVRVVSDPPRIRTALAGSDRTIFDDHQSSSAARHFLLRDGDDSCYLITRRDRRKGLPLFASILHVSEPDVFTRRARSFFSHLLVHDRIPLTLLEGRLADCAPFPSRRISRPRPKMFKSTTLSPADIDYLYSELTQIAW